jgi:hypothetical protein
MKCTLKNLIRGAFKKPIILIGYIFVAIFLIGMIVLSFAMPAGLVRQASPDLFTGIMMLVFTVLYYTTLKLGVDKGSTYFRMADVNLVFTAPVRPNQVLLYGFIKQIVGTFFLLFIAMFQIPNLKNNFEIKPYGVIMLMLAVVAYALSYPLISMVIYSWASKVKSRRKVVKRVMDVCALAVAAVLLLSLYQTRNFGATLDAVLNNPIARYFPVIGWTGAIASSAAMGFTAEFWVGLIGMVALIIGASVTLYRMNLDFYEDVLEGTEYVEAAMKAKREGNNMTFNVKVKDKVNTKLSGSGASAIFSKHMLEIKKTSYFLFFDRTSIIIIIAALVFKFMMPEEIGAMSLSMVLGFSVYMLLLFQIQGRLGIEMDKHYIYLIPASSQEKLFYSTLSQHVKNLFDGLVLFIMAGVLFKADVQNITACIITYLAFGAVFVYTDVLSRKLFGWVHSKGLLVFIKIFVTLLIFIPGIVAAVIAGMATESELFAILALGGWSLILAITLFIFSSNILNNLESAG